MAMFQRKEAIIMTKNIGMIWAAVLIAGCVTQRTTGAPPVDAASRGDQGQIIGRSSDRPPRTASSLN